MMLPISIRGGKLLGYGLILGFVAMEAGVTLIHFPSLLQSTSSNEAPGEVGGRFKPRSRPLPLKAATLPGLYTRDEIASILGSISPRFNTGKMMDSFPIDMIIHSLRLWGMEARASTGPAIDGELTVRSLSGEEMAGILFDHEKFVQASKVVGTGLLRDSSFGVEVLIAQNFSFGCNERIPHLGKLMQVAAEIGLPSDHAVRTMGGRVRSVADILRDDAARCVDGVELEWLASGLSRYAESGEPWSNRFDQRRSFDEMGQQLLSMRPGIQACCGTHVPYALATLLRVDEVVPILRPETRGKVEDYLTRLSRALEGIQGGDGSWRWEWAEALPGGIVTARIAGWQGADFPSTITVTGHHLEWIARAPERFRPSPACTRKAARYLVESWAELKELLRTNWHAHNIATHAAKALCELGGVSPGTVQPADGPTPR